MVNLGLSSIHPKQDAFERHNLTVQKGFEKSPMISEECVNWYRLGKKVVVPNSTSGGAPRLELLWVRVLTSQVQLDCGGRLARPAGPSGTELAVERGPRSSRRSTSVGCTVGARSCGAWRRRWELLR